MSTLPDASAAVRVEEVTSTEGLEETVPGKLLTTLRYRHRRAAKLGTVRFEAADG